MSTEREPTDLDVRLAAVQAAAAGLRKGPNPDNAGNPALAAEKATQAVITSAEAIERYIKWG